MAPGSVDEKEFYAEKVKTAFRKAWNAYKEYAWGLDAVNPISQKGHNWYAEPLLMTPVDAYSTMCIMGLEEEKKEAKELILSFLLSLLPSVLPFFFRQGLRNTGHGVVASEK